jgi:hypothetical protein
MACEISSCFGADTSVLADRSSELSHFGGDLRGELIFGTVDRTRPENLTAGIRRNEHQLRIAAPQYPALQQDVLSAVDWLGSGLDDADPFLHCLPSSTRTLSLQASINAAWRSVPIAFSIAPNTTRGGANLPARGAEERRLNKTRPRPRRPTAI